jgi:hypothetical protein
MVLSKEKDASLINHFFPYVAIMVLDVLIRHVPSTLYSTVGRSFFTPADKRPLPNGAEVWQGYYQSARPTVGKFII